MRGGWVYIMTNRPNGTLNVGVTANLGRRAYEHREGPPKAEADIAEAARVTLSERDSLRVRALLEHPPAAPDRLVRAAKAGFALP